MSVALLTSDERHSPRGERVAALAERLDRAAVVTTTGDPQIDEVTGRFDAAVAFGWRACLHLGRLDARAYAYVVPALEDALLWHGDERRLLATLTYDLPGVTLISESDAVADELRARAPDAEIVTVPRGYDKESLTPGDRSDDRPLRVLVAGDASEVLARTQQPVDAQPLSSAARPDAYRRADVVLELSPAEQPLDAAPEAMHTGCVPVVTPVRGHSDFVEDGQSGVVVAFDDVPGTARTLDLLARDRGRLAELRAGALARAAQLPSLDDAAKRFQRALDGLPRDGRPPQRLLLNAVAALEGVASERRKLEQVLRDQEQEIQRLQRQAATPPLMSRLLSRVRRGS